MPVFCSKICIEAYFQLLLWVNKTNLKFLKEIKCLCSALLIPSPVGVNKNLPMPLFFNDDLIHQICPKAKNCLKVLKIIRTEPGAENNLYKYYENLCIM